MNNTTIERTKKNTGMTVIPKGAILSLICSKEEIVERFIIDVKIEPNRNVNVPIVATMRARNLRITRSASTIQKKTSKIEKKGYNAGYESE